MPLPPDIGQPPAAVFVWVQFGSNNGGSSTSGSDAYAQAVSYLKLGDAGSGVWSLSGFYFGGSSSVEGRYSDFGDGSIYYSYQAAVTAYVYKFAFYSGTCYVAIYWDVLETVSSATQGSGPGANQSTSSTTTTPHSFIWDPPSNGGVCLPSNFQSFADYSNTAINDDTRVSFSDTFQLLPPAPAVAVPSDGIVTFASVADTVQNVRWSFVKGYIPPADGSANGFPP